MLIFFQLNQRGVCGWFAVKERMKAGLQSGPKTGTSGYSRDHVNNLM